MTQIPDRSLADRIEELLSGTARVAVPLPEIADQLDTSPAIAAARIRDDPRFVLIQPPPFPDLAMLPDADRSAYGEALRAAGVHGTPSVALRDPGDTGRDRQLDLLLRDSVARLLVENPEPALVAAAERIRSVVTDVTRPHPDPVETAPSTTPPPGPPARKRDPPRRRHSPPARPPYPGSRRG